MTASYSLLPVPDIAIPNVTTNVLIHMICVTAAGCLRSSVMKWYTFGILRATCKPGVDVHLGKLPEVRRRTLFCKQRATTLLCCAFEDMKEKFLSFERPPGFADSPSDKGCFEDEGECGALIERY